MEFTKMKKYLIVLNLLLIAIFLILKLKFISTFFHEVFNIIIVPIIFSVFIYYIIRPLNNLILKMNLKKGFVAIVTILIFIGVVGGLLFYFGTYFFKQFVDLINNFKDIFLNEDKIKKFIDGLDNYINADDIYNYTVKVFEKYMNNYIFSIFGIVKRGINVFSDVLLVVLIVFGLLNEGDKLKESFLKLIVPKYKKLSENILIKLDEVLSSYITGQALVALSLATMVYFGYLFIGIPHRLILALITFILAFIPFVGFFISMIIPYILAITMGFMMVVKLSAIFLIAQTLKGRVVVPFIMSKAMNIHPITDIFLVMLAVALFGPLGAFIVVPIYSMIKILILEVRAFQNK